MAWRFFEKLLTFLFDILAIIIAFAATFWLRYKSNLFPETFDPLINLTLQDYGTPLVVWTVAWLLLFFFTGLYRDWYKESRLDEFFVVTRTVLIGMALLYLVLAADELAEFVKTGEFPALFTRTQLTMLLTYGSGMLLFANLDRFAVHTFLAWLFSSGLARHKVMIVGANHSGEELLRELKAYPHMGYEVVGFIDDNGRRTGSLFAGLPVRGTYSDIAQVVKTLGVSGLILSEVSNSPNEIVKIINYCGDVRLPIYMVPSLTDVISGHFKTNQIFGVPLMVLLQDHMPAWEAQVKRIMDFTVSLGVLLLGAPLWVLVGLMVKLTSPGPIVYRQERVGRNGKNFVMMKFRSMYSDAEKRSGPQWATQNDPRITPFGRFMRKTRLDEIPQFVNVLLGEMSLVGPRPERPFFVEMLKKEIPWYVRRIKMTPGITGWAQVKHKYDETIEDVKQKVKYDLFYFENMSLMLDIKIMVRTIMVVFTGKGAH